MSIFSHIEFDQHEQVLFCQDPASGLKAIIAIHNTQLGPALGGCRMWPYASDAEALTDVLRLSKGMSYKSAVAGLPLGGGKCVIIGDPRKDKNPKMLQALGRFIEGLSGAYITAEDSGTSVADMKTIAQQTQYAAGIEGSDEHGGDPSPYTAYGTFVGLKAAVKHKFGSDNLQGLKVAIQGVGNVGYHLAKHLHQSGAELIVTDIFAEQLKQVQEEFNATVVKPEAIYSVDADVYSPCALGGSLNADTIKQLKAKVVAGAANNQLARPEVSQLLDQCNILYTPDYVLNAGGIIDIAYQRSAEGQVAKMQHIEKIGETLTEIFKRADEQQLPSYQVADQLAEERFKRTA